MDASARLGMVQYHLLQYRKLLPFEYYLEGTLYQKKEVKGPIFSHLVFELDDVVFEKGLHFG